jgi:hypothetical protein
VVFMVGLHESFHPCCIGNFLLGFPRRVSHCSPVVPQTSAPMSYPLIT